MKTIFKPLANMDFANVLVEAYADTQTGTSLINKYRQYLLTNESSCTLVNNFLKEAKNCLYDSGIVNVVNSLTETISENSVSWQLATACEAINSNKSSYNYLNRNAASTVEKLLEQNGAEVVLSLADILNEPSEEHGYHELYGVFGSNESNFLIS